MSLQTYRAKRNFKRTTEPSAGKAARSRGRKRAPIFVVQKHAATQLHYDFRLEIDGVLKSWAVPKGFPTRRGERHLAVQVEDHPLNYAYFEGIIAPGNYGAGTVMVWDQGAFEVVNDEPSQALESGKLRLKLHGEKLNGEWTLVRMGSRGGSKPQWLLIKSESDVAPISSRAENESALTHRTFEEIETSKGRQVRPRQAAKVAAKPPPPAPEPELPEDTRGLKKAKPHFIEPMKCELVEELPKGRDWIYEVKFDGVRALAVKTGRKLSLLSRSGKELGAKYPEVVAALKQLPAGNAVVDGEIVALDAKGRSSFQLLQAYNMKGHAKPPIFFYAFDLLNLDGKVLQALPLVKRKEMLKALLASPPEIIRFSANIEADSKRVLKEMQALGLEGLIAKRKDSRYEPGRRSGAWVKFKWTNEQEFVIGGFTEPKGTRAHFGALLIGYYEKGEFKFASKVGTGFDRATLESLHKTFQKFIRRDCPFVDLPTQRLEEGSLGVTAAEMKRCTWLDPKLVCQIRFSEWTRDGHLRQPVYLGLRDDKKPTEVTREVPR